MSQQAIQAVTNAAIRMWIDSESELTYVEYIHAQKAKGRFWGAKEIL